MKRGGETMKTPVNAFRWYSTWTITLCASLLMNLALFGFFRSADMLLRDLSMCGVCTAAGLGAAALWWHLRRWEPHESEDVRGGFH